MTSLPEELLNHVLSFVTVDHHDGSLPEIESLRSVSIVPQQLQRLAAPHLFRVYDVNEAHVDGRRHMNRVQPALLQYVVELYLYYDIVGSDTVAIELIGSWPNIKVLDISVANGRVHYANTFHQSFDRYLHADSYYNLPKTPSLRTVYLGRFLLGGARDRFAEHDTDNPSVTTLHVQLVNYWYNWSTVIISLDCRTVSPT
jgi:hypothetical protein